MRMAAFSRKDVSGGAKTRVGAALRPAVAPNGGVFKGGRERIKTHYVEIFSPYSPPQGRAVAPIGGLLRRGRNRRKPYDRNCFAHDPDPKGRVGRKVEPVFGKDHAQTSQGRLAGETAVIIARLILPVAMAVAALHSGAAA